MLQSTRPGRKPGKSDPTKLNELAARRNRAAIDVACRLRELPEEAGANLAVVQVLMGNASRSTIYRHVKAGTLPTPIVVDRRPLFRVGDLRQALAKLLPAASQ